MEFTEEITQSPLTRQEALELELQEAEHLVTDLYVERHECYEAIDQMYTALREIDKRIIEAEAAALGVRFKLTTMWKDEPVK